MKDNVQVEVAFQHNDGYNEVVDSFVNNIKTPEGGTHLTGFRNSLTKTFNDYARKNKILKDSDQGLSGDDIREGLTAIVSVKIEDPQFEGQTKQKLGNTVARGAVDSIVSEQLTYFLEQNPAVAKSICEKSLLAQRAREAARKARDLTRRKTALESTSLPGKLADCSDKDPKIVRYISLREIQPVVLQRLQEAVLHRQSFHFVVRFLTLRKQDLTEYLEMQRLKR